MLLAHGYGCDQTMWRRMVPLLENDYRLALFDYVGYGQSDVTAYDPIDTRRSRAMRKT